MLLVAVVPHYSKRGCARLCFCSMSVLMSTRSSRLRRCNSQSTDIANLFEMNFQDTDGVEKSAGSDTISATHVIASSLLHTDVGDATTMRRRGSKTHSCHRANQSIRVTLTSEKGERPSGIKCLVSSLTKRWIRPASTREQIRVRTYMHPVRAWTRQTRYYLLTSL